MKKNIELLEEEINSLGAAWNLFGKVDAMKFLLKKIKDELHSDFEFEAEIQKKAFTSYHNHGILELKIPYCYYKIAELDKDKDLKVSLKYLT